MDKLVDEKLIERYVSFFRWHKNDMFSEEIY